MGRKYDQVYFLYYSPDFTNKIIIASLLVIFAIGLYATPDAFADHNTGSTVTMAENSGVPGCEETSEGCFIPSTVTIAVGGYVEWQNTDTTVHVVSSGDLSDEDAGSLFDSGMIMAGGSYESTFDEEGTYPYFCMVHPWMVGTVIVGEGSHDDHGDEHGDDMTEMESETTSSTSSSSNTVTMAENSGVPGCEETAEGCFLPTEVTIAVGGHIEWQNTDNTVHVVSSGNLSDDDAGSLFDSGMIMAGANFEHTFEDEGVYPYFCMVHPWMIGTVIVGEGGTTESTSSEEVEAAEADAEAAAAEAEAAAAEAAARIAEAEAEAAAAEAEAAARIAEAEAAARIAAAEAAAKAAEEAAEQTIAALSPVNEKIEITMDFSNETGNPQTFAFLVQIKNENNLTISLSNVTGILGAGQTLDQVLSYTPTESGTYTIEKYLWSDIANPTALTDQKETFAIQVT